MIAPIITSEGLDEEYDINLDVSVVPSIYVESFAGGEFNTAPIGVNHYSNLISQGADLRIFTAFSLPTQAWYSLDDSVNSLEDFEGKTVAAPMASAGFGLADALSQNIVGEPIDELATMLNADSPQGALLEMDTGNADIALSWELATSTYLAERENSELHEIVTIRDQYRRTFNSQAFHLVWAAHGDFFDDNREQLRGLLNACRDANEIIENDTERAVDILAENTENDRVVIERALDGIVSFQFDPIDQLQEDMQQQAQVYVDIDVADEVPPEDIYVDP